MHTTQPAGPLTRLRSAPLSARAAFALLPLTVLTAVVAMVSDWRGAFTLDPNQGSVADDWALNGCAISMPVAPLVVALAAALLATRADRWRILGFVLIALVGLVTVFGAIGELTSEPTVHTPQIVLWIASPVHAAIGLALIGLAVRDIARTNR